MDIAPDTPRSSGDLLSEIAALLHREEQRTRERIRAAEARADTAEEALRRSEEQAGQLLASARAEAERLVERGRTEADRLISEARSATEAERMDWQTREREFVSALRSYLHDIDEAQTSLLRVARRALTEAGVARPEGPPTADGSDRRGPAPQDGPHGLPSAGSTTDGRSPATGSATPQPFFPGWAPDRNHGTMSTNDGPGPVAEIAQQSVKPPEIGPVRDLGMGVAGEPITDEHHLIDLHNRQDMARVHAPSGGRRLFGLKPAAWLRFP